MLLELDLPRPLDEELTLEAEREGMPKQEHALLLVCLANALLRDEERTPFKNAVRLFLSHNSLDTDRIALVFERLVRLCSEAHDQGKASAAFQTAVQSLTPHGASPETLLLALKGWRNVTVHHSSTVVPGVDMNADVVLSSLNPMHDLTQRAGRVSRDESAEATEGDRSTSSLMGTPSDSWHGGGSDAPGGDSPVAVISPIILDEQGVAWIEGTTTKVIEVVLNKEWTGQPAEELQRDMPHLTLAQVYAALSYYHAHKDELDADIERREQLVEQLRAESGVSPVAERLRAVGKLR